MKTLKCAFYDRGNCRLYVNDDSKKVFRTVQGNVKASHVIVDEGHTMEKWGMPRFVLHTMTSSGEPDVPLDVAWTLVDGIPESNFKPGLTYLPSNTVNVKSTQTQIRESN